MKINLYKNKAYLIVFEGIDGSGKSTLSKLLKKFLENNNYDVVLLREPSNSKYGKKIREIAKNKSSIPIQEELNYFIEDRKWNVKNNILPNLKKNKIVILDRYFFSTACYQGARGLDMKEILTINRNFAPEPDFVFVIDVDVKTALSRINNSREQTVKLFEKQEFLEKVRENYLKLKGNNIYIINGKDSIEKVFKNILELL